MKHKKNTHKSIASCFDSASIRFPTFPLALSIYPCCLEIPVARKDHKEEAWCMGLNH